MTNQNKLILIISFLILVACSCSKVNNEDEIIINDTITRNLTIFFVNDQHGQIENFSKIKYIIEQEKQNTNVLVACAGDIFSGNPVVDNYGEKGFPMIDVMNKVGFDISALGNHEFDYGEATLKDRIEQSDFDWVCANVEVNNTGIPEPFDYKTLTVGDLRVTFLGLIETNGKQNATIPATHPWKVQNLSFLRPENVVSQYQDVKEQENADLYIALTHLGQDYSNNDILGDVDLANNYPYFDIIIGGHTHRAIDTVVNNIPIYYAGAYLITLGKLNLKIKKKQAVAFDFELIDLPTYANYDADLKATIDEYNNMPGLDDVIGYSEIHHYRNYNLGCFITDALRNQMSTDISFQNPGGIRNDLNEGDITKREIYAISPFHNGTVIYSMTIDQIKTFLKESGSGFYYSGIIIEQNYDEVVIKNTNNELLADDIIMTVGIIDYIPAVYDNYFPANGNIQPYTEAETIINWLISNSQPVEYPECRRYFRYN